MVDGRQLLALVVAVLAMCDSASRTAAGLTCHNYKDNHVFQEYATNAKKNASVCQSTAGKAAASCFEYAGVRNGSGPMIYGSGCGSACPNGSNLQCWQCKSSLCNNATLASIKASNRFCYTGHRPISAMSENRKRKVWCANGEKQCFLITWTSQSKKVKKYIGGCGKQQCNKKMNCTYQFCHQNLCNAPPDIKKKPCPSIGCHATGLAAHGPALLLLTALTAVTAAAALR